MNGLKEVVEWEPGCAEGEEIRDMSVDERSVI